MISTSPPFLLDCVSLCRATSSLLHGGVGGDGIAPGGGWDGKGSRSMAVMAAVPLVLNDLLGNKVFMTGLIAFCAAQIGKVRA